MMGFLSEMGITHESRGPTCVRCGGSARTSTMSILDEGMICMGCKGKEGKLRQGCVDATEYLTNLIGEY